MAMLRTVADGIAVTRVTTRLQGRFDSGQLVAFFTSRESRRRKGKVYQDGRAHLILSTVYGVVAVRRWRVTEAGTCEVCTGDELRRAARSRLDARGRGVRRLVVLLDGSATTGEGYLP